VISCWGDGKNQGIFFLEDFRIEGVWEGEKKRVLRLLAVRNIGGRVEIRG